MCSCYKFPFLLSNLIGVTLKMDLLSTLLSAVLLLLALILVRALMNSKPPGPWGLPLVGSLPFIGRRAYITFARWAEVYGPVFSLNLGPKTVVVLNSQKAFQEAFVKKGEYFNHRIPRSLLREVVKGKGILNNEGPVWREHRRFTVSCLRDFGFGKSTMENHIMDEIEDFAQDMELFKGKAFDPKACLTTSVANVVWSLAAGRRFPRGDPKLLELQKVNEDIIQILGSVGVLTFYPQLRFFFNQRFQKFKASMEKLQGFLQTEIDNHRRTMSQCERDDDLVYQYLKEGERQIKAGKKTTFTDEQIRAVLLDLFVAGVETTVTTLRWILLLLILNPDVQRRIQAEIDDVVGTDRQPSYDDRLLMPYTEAAIAEVQRYSCVIPTIMHCASDNTQLMGFQIPRHASVLGNIWSLHKDPGTWKHPNDFFVDHFLDQSGNFQKPEAFCPFGTGRRSCLGESLAKMEIFLFVTKLLQKYTFFQSEGEQYLLKSEHGLVLSPKPFKLCVSRR